MSVEPMLNYRYGCTGECHTSAQSDNTHKPASFPPLAQHSETFKCTFHCHDGLINLATQLKFNAKPRHKLHDVSLQLRCAKRHNHSTAQHAFCTVSEAESQKATQLTDSARSFSHKPRSKLNSEHDTFKHTVWLHSLSKIAAAHSPIQTTKMASC